MKKKLWILIVIFFFQGIITNMHHPLMPAYVEFLDYPDYMFGFFFSFMNLGTMLGGPFWGNLGDKGKKRLVVILGFVIYGVFQALFGLGTFFGPWILSFFRFASGFGIAAALTVIAGEIILLSEPKEKGKNIMFGVAALAIGGSVGQFLGGQMRTNEFLVKFFSTDQFFFALLFQCVLNILLAIIVYFVFKPLPVRDSAVEKRASFLQGFKDIAKVGPELLFFLLSLTFVTFAATNVDKYLDVLIVRQYKYDEAFLGKFKMISGLFAITATIFIVPFLIKLTKRLKLIGILQIISAILVFFAFNFIGKNNFVTILYTAIMFYLIIKALYAPLEQDHIASFADDTNTATIMGIRSSFFSIGTILGPLVGGFLYAKDPKILFNTSVLFFLLSVVLLGVSHHFGKKSRKQKAQ